MGELRETSQTFMDLNLMNIASTDTIRELLFNEYIHRRTDLSDLELITLSYKFNIPQLDSMLESFTINNQY